MSWRELTTSLRAILPEEVKRIWRRRRIAAARRRNRGRPVAEIFGDIYQDNRWGGEQGSFNSGSGSTSEHARAYAAMVRDFIATRGIRRVVDVGCGDFRVGAQIVEASTVYVGVDVVERLVQENQRRYGSETVSFVCLDVIENELPAGELCLIRQVLQHLSNAQIQKVLARTAGFRHVLVTEHYPAPAALRAKNLDKPCGEDVRIYDGSAVFLDAPPFDRVVTGPLLDVDAGSFLMQPGERIRTYLIENQLA